MKAIAMFGPCHGVQFDVPLPQQDWLLVEPGKELPRFEEYRFGEPYPKSKIISHHYVLLDVFSDDMNGEDCALYVHNPMCPAKHEGDEETEDELAIRRKHEAADEFGMPVGEPVSMSKSRFFDMYAHGVQTSNRKPGGRVF